MCGWLLKTFSCIGYEIGPQSAHHWIRAAIVDNLRTRDYYLVDTLIGGYDEHSSKPYLGMVDHLGTYIDQEPYMFRGFGLTFSYAILDKIYKSSNDFVHFQVGN